MKRIGLIFLLLAAMVLANYSLLYSRGQHTPKQGEPVVKSDILPAMPVPADNPQSDLKIKLGMQLFFDKRLSVDNTVSCATCHDPKTGWANHDKTDTGVKGGVGERNSGTIINSGYMRYQFWDGRAVSLEEQALGPISNPIEMGESLEDVIKKLNAIPGYRSQFKAVFGTKVTSDGIANAIAAFERTIVSGMSPYDIAIKSGKPLIGPAGRGEKLFYGKGRCYTCHNGPTFSDQSFHNLGVGMNAKRPDIGREGVTKDPKDRGKFKTPGLRCVALTAPYLHDGSAATLKDVIELINRGGEPNPNLDPLMLPLRLTKQEILDLVAFLEALTGPVPIMEAPELPANR